MKEREQKIIGKWEQRSPASTTTNPLTDLELARGCSPTKSLLSGLLHDTSKRSMYACICVSVCWRAQCLCPRLLLGVRQGDCILCLCASLHPWEFVCGVCAPASVWERVRRDTHMLGTVTLPLPSMAASEPPPPPLQAPSRITSRLDSTGKAQGSPSRRCFGTGLPVHGQRRPTTHSLTPKGLCAFLYQRNLSHFELSLLSFQSHPTHASL